MNASGSGHPLLIVALLALSSQCGAAAAGPYGAEAHSPPQAARILKITASTRHVIVDHEESLIITNLAGQSFAWRFDTLYCPTGFPLAQIAPSDFDAHDAWIYVRPVR